MGEDQGQPPGSMSGQSPTSNVSQKTPAILDSPVRAREMAEKEVLDVHRVQTSGTVKTHNSTPPRKSSPVNVQSSIRQDSKQSEPRSSEAADADAEQARNSPTFLSQPLSFLWRRFKWSLILSLGRNDSFTHLNKEDMKTAVATQLEVAIMGSALVLTLCLQMQEVVGSRGGFTLPERDRARFVFVSSSALSFSFAFYSIITSAMMLLSINAVPRRSAERFFTGVSSWSAIPRLCTLIGALCLGIAAMSAFFLGLEDSTAWIGVAVTAIALLLTIMSTVFIITRVRRLQNDILEQEQECPSKINTECRVDIDPEGSPTKKLPDISCPDNRSSSFQPVLTPLSSLTNTTGFSIRTSRYHN